MNNRLKRILTWAFLLASVVLIGAFLYVSNRLARQLEAEEKVKIETWAEAYRNLIMADANADMSLELKVIEGNTTIPVFLTSPDGTLIPSGFYQDDAQMLADRAAEFGMREVKRKVDNSWTMLCFKKTTVSTTAS